eukprot:s2013_g3.t1
MYFLVAKPQLVRTLRAQFRSGESSIVIRTGWLGYAAMHSLLPVLLASKSRPEGAENEPRMSRSGKRLAPAALAAAEAAAVATLADAAASVRAQTAAKVAVAEAEALANLADASRATRRSCAEAVEVEVPARPHPPAGPLPSTSSKRQKTEDTKKR